MLVGNHYLKDAQIQALRPRVTFTPANIWKVERADGVVSRFASHDKWLTFQREQYQPMGPTASDLEQSEAGGESDFEMVGFLSAETILAADIHAGRYEGCKVTHHVVDWMRPWMWFRKHVWWVKEINENGGLFQAQVQGVDRFLTIPVGRVYERECDKTFGSGECGATPRVLFGAVVEAVASSGSTILGLPHHTMAMRFTNASWAWSPAIRDGLLTMGRVVWTSGPNKGTTQDIAEHIGREVALDAEAPFPIKAGDTAAIYSGCDGSASMCEFDYANKLTFGGQEFMPSTEDLYRKPAET
ncbi:MAG: DUF2163 domain-containing protein [Planctomycetes bacterium]|nr:DUF2163 domain-containing protein [Planctomycetota bacterium]